MSQYESRTDEKQEMYLVLVNHEEQYSLWPSYKQIPAGWKAVGKERTKEECLAYIDEVWTDMRPLSLRKQILIMTSMIFLGLSSAKAMMDDNEKEKTLMSSKTPFIQQSIDQKEVMLSKPSKEDTSFESLSDSLFIHVFSFLDIMDLGGVAQVSPRWKKAAYAPYVWRSMGSRYYGDYLNEEDLKEDPKQKVISHYLSVIVNSSNNLQEIERLVSHYQLHLYVLPFKKGYLGRFYPESFLEILTDGVEDLSSREELIMQGNEYYIQKKLNGLCGGSDGYTEDLEAAREFNESLVEKEIQRLLRGK